jgi:hypothetical protein
MSDIAPEGVFDKIKAGETFIVNIVTAWCPDCTARQRPNFPLFVEKLAQYKLAVYEITVQSEPNVYLSKEHEKLTDLFGGHGFPRTSLVKSGKIVDSDNVEVTSAGALKDLAEKFIGFL